ncbi:hypothetical protein GCK32_005015 [Trichostrongylus colubriformis]|uniref:Uncharacterized protein n=1 Tax=Trichostrongylus colubriformis TaxID=6319 RepID=A0AAN8J248_TRICO
MAVIFIIGLSLLIAVNTEEDATNDTYKKCKGKLADPKQGLDLPKWCTNMRIDVGSCMSKQLKIKDDGSIASRGNVLLQALKQYPDVELLKDVKLYHYGCLYNNWRDYFEDDCFRSMVKECVYGEKSCYYRACPGLKNSKKSLKQKLEKQKSLWKSISDKENNSWVRVPYTALILTGLICSINLI